MGISGNWDRRRRLVSRREFVGIGGMGVAALAFGLVGPSESEAQSRPRFGENPFGLGVASGDPLPDGVVLWTRLAPEPLDPFGGMPDRRVPVRWELAEDEGFRRVVRRGTEVATPEYVHSVHVDVRGLRAGREYFYRFRVGDEESPVGRTKTAPARGASPAAFAFAVASCQHYPSGYYNAYRHMAEEDLDLVVHLGDYIYEGGDQGTLGRGHAPARETYSLDDYRVRHAQYKTDGDLRAVHAAFPWLVTWDDHEVANNWADEDHPSDPPEDFLVRRANAFRAYWEHMPIRRERMPVGFDMPLYRRVAFGDLAEFNVLDTRQYRDDQSGAGRLDPSRTITGDEQERWLIEGLARSTATWNVLAQQVFMAQWDLNTGEGQTFSTDTWDGYVASRDRVLGAVQERGVRNPIVVTGDVHSNWANDLKADFDDPDSATIGSEFVGTSISSFNDGADTTPRDEAIVADNPHIKYFNGQRGYVRCELTPEEWRTDYRVVPYVTRPGAPIRTDATFVVESGRPGLQPA